MKRKGGKLNLFLIFNPLSSQIICLDVKSSDYIFKRNKIVLLFTFLSLDD